MRIGDCMKRAVVSVSPSTTVQEAAQLIVDKHIGTLPVVNAQGVVVGMLTIRDILKIFLPDFVALLDNIDFVRDFGAMEKSPKDVPGAARLTVKDVMQPPVTIEEDCGLLRAYAVLDKHSLRDLPVVDKAGRLVGIASRVDIAVAFLSAWQKNRSVFT